MQKQLRNHLIICLLIFNSTISFGQSKEFEELKSLEIMDQIFEHLDLYFVDEIKQGQLSKTAIDAMLKELDPYTVYYHEANIEDYKLMTTGQYGGIGSLIRIIDNEPYITDPYEGNPAQKTGVKAGDKIISIDTKPVKGKSIDEVSDALKGPKGTNVRIEIERLGLRKVFEIKRDEIKIPDVPYAGILNQKIGYIALNSFTQTASDEVKKNLIELQSKGIEGLILDLRGNGGGLLVEAVKIVNLFVSKGQTVVFTKGRTKTENVVYTTLGEPIAEKIPLVVLIDEGSASASEIVAGSLQDLDRAVIVGSTSYGKGLVQRTFDLKYGSKVKLTIAKYYTPSGRCVQRLEYNENGNKPKEIPDSLLQKFKTKNGREVIDGRGIEPDLKIDDSNFSDITKTLLVQNKIFHFATSFAATHDSISSPEIFDLNDQDFNSFISYLQNGGFEYTSPSEKLLEKIKAELEKEQGFSMVNVEYNALLEKINSSEQLLLNQNKNEIINLLEDEIVSRYYFQKGRTVHSFNVDPVATKAINVLNDPQLYNNTLHIK